jgi:hypothetical protein
MFIHKKYTFNRNKYSDKSKVNIEWIVLVFHNEGHANLRYEGKNLMF